MADTQPSAIETANHRLLTDFADIGHFACRENGLHPKLSSSQRNTRFAKFDMRLNTPNTPSFPYGKIGIPSCQLISSENLSLIRENFNFDIYKQKIHA